MLATVTLGFIAVLVVLLAIGATRPRHFHVARRATISAPPTVVYAQLEDIRLWSQWNPFQRSDPTIRVTYSGPRAGVGASYHFKGNRVGEGRMTLTETRPNERVSVQGEFIRPITATHRIDFVLEPDGKATALTWSITGEKPLVARALGLLCNMDEHIGAEFDKGLAHLKFVAESSALRPVGI